MSLVKCPPETTRKVGWRPVSDSDYRRVEHPEKDFTGKSRFDGGMQGLSAGRLSNCTRRIVGNIEYCIDKRDESNHITKCENLKKKLKEEVPLSGGGGRLAGNTSGRATYYINPA